MNEELNQTAADGLEVVGYATESALGVLIGKRNSEQTDWQSVWSLDSGGLIALCRLTDAQRLLSQLREELAQRDAEVSKWKALAQGATTILDIEQSRQERSTRLGLESQQAASVGGEREEFLRWCEIEQVEPSSETGFMMWEAWQARAALSPAGGGVVMQEGWVNGFPPAGELCEARIPHHTAEGMQMLWSEVEVICHALIKGVVYSWVKEPGVDGGYYAPLMLSFRRIETDSAKPQANSQEADKK